MQPANHNHPIEEYLNARALAKKADKPTRALWLPRRFGF
jgi:hypothetical protein